MPLIPALGRQRQANFLVPGQPGLQSEFQDNQCYTEKPCLKKPKKQNNNNKMLVYGAEEVAQQLGALAALPEDLDSIPSTHMWLTSSVTPAPGKSTLFSGLQGHQAHMWYAYIQASKMYTKRNNINLKSKYTKIQR